MEGWTAKAEGSKLEGLREEETMVGREEGSIDHLLFRRRHLVLARVRRLERTPAPLPGQED